MIAAWLHLSCVRLGLKNYQVHDPNARIWSRHNDTTPLALHHLRAFALERLSGRVSFSREFGWVLHFLDSYYSSSISTLTCVY